jgi:hypothetical protein
MRTTKCQTLAYALLRTPPLFRCAHKCELYLYLSRYTYHLFNLFKLGHLRLNSSARGRFDKAVFALPAALAHTLD